MKSDSFSLKHKSLSLLTILFGHKISGSDDKGIPIWKSYSPSILNNKTIYFACAAGQSVFSSRLDKSSYLPVPLLLIVLNDNQKYKVI